MSTDTPISDLVVNKLTYDQYKEVIDGNTYDNTQLYEIKDISSVFATQNGTISNCILEIPQNFKIEITSDGWINLIEGSIVTVVRPIYTTVTTTTYPANYNNQQGVSPSNKYLCIFWNSGSGCLIYPVEAVYSGTSQPTTAYTKSRWFNTTTKTWYKSDDTGATWTNDGDLNGWTYPLCMLEKDENLKWQLAKDSEGRDMIFNGTGFIGHHTFVYPGVKGLIPNGFNDDGSLKSELWEINQLLIRELETNVTNYGLMLQANYPYLNYSNKSYWQYSNEQNKFIHNQNSILFTELANYSVDSNNTVTDFTIRQPVRLMTGVTYRQW